MNRSTYCLIGLFQIPLRLRQRHNGIGASKDFAEHLCPENPSLSVVRCEDKRDARSIGSGAYRSQTEVMNVDHVIAGQAEGC